MRDYFKILEDVKLLPSEVLVKEIAFPDQNKQGILPTAILVAEMHDRMRTKNAAQGVAAIEGRNQGVPTVADHVVSSFSEALSSPYEVARGPNQRFPQAEQGMQQGNMGQLGQPGFEARHGGIVGIPRYQEGGRVLPTRGGDQGNRMEALARIIDDPNSSLEEIEAAIREMERFKMEMDQVEEGFRHGGPVQRFQKGGISLTMEEIERRVAEIDTLVAAGEMSLAEGEIAKETVNSMRERPVGVETVQFEGQRLRGPTGFQLPSEGILGVRTGDMPRADVGRTVIGAENRGLQQPVTWAPEGDLGIRTLGQEKDGEKPLLSRARWTDQVHPFSLVQKSFSDIGRDTKEFFSPSVEKSIRMQAASGGGYGGLKPIPSEEIRLDDKGMDELIGTFNPEDVILQAEGGEGSRESFTSDDILYTGDGKRPPGFPEITDSDSVAHPANMQTPFSPDHTWATTDQALEWAPWNENPEQIAPWNEDPEWKGIPYTRDSNWGQRMMALGAGMATAAEKPGASVAGSFGSGMQGYLAQRQKDEAMDLAVSQDDARWANVETQQRLADLQERMTEPRIKELLGKSSYYDAAGQQFDRGDELLANASAQMDTVTDNFEEWRERTWGDSASGISYEKEIEMFLQENPEMRKKYIDSQRMYDRATQLLGMGFSQRRDPVDTRNRYGPMDLVATENREARPLNVMARATSEQDRFQ